MFCIALEEVDIQKMVMVEITDGIANIYFSFSVHILNFVRSLTLLSLSQGSQLKLPLTLAKVMPHTVIDDMRFVYLFVQWTKCFTTCMYSWCNLKVNKVSYFTAKELKCWARSWETILLKLVLFFGSRHLSLMQVEESHASECGSSTHGMQPDQMATKQAYGSQRLHSTEIVHSLF